MEGPVRLWPVLVLLVIQLAEHTHSFGFEDTLNEGSPCYDQLEDESDDLERPMRCMPPFKNVISNAHVQVDPPEMTCGIRQSAQYCLQTGGYYRECQICDAYDSKQGEARSHNASYLTDIHTDQNQTSWQSVTMDENVHMNLVNLTINMRKAFDITYVRLKFSSPRPESFAIYKKVRNEPWNPDPDPENGWIPWQFYSASCRDTYRVPESLSIIQPQNEGDTRYAQKVGEDRALCTSEFSDISPLSGGNVAFATLDGRPGAYNFDHNRELQYWVSATDIRVSLMRLNTFGDEVFGDPKVLRSYYYGITHFIVGGRCKCNGHSNVCIPSDPADANSRMICLCKHGTTGDDCESCLPDHWDRPWKRATSEKPNPCLPCECNGWASRCQFNEELYSSTKRGGKCIDCEGNRDGPHCEVCKVNNYISPVKDAFGRQPCEPCDCDPTGSTDLQCSIDGKCQCKPGVTGDKCDRCEANYWNFPEEADAGCESCDCMVEGSQGNRPSCDTGDGACECKQNVEGQRCDRCKSGHFYIDLDNEFGCTPCFCYGHTAQCQMAPGYTRSLTVSDFSRGSDNWGSEEAGLPSLAQATFSPFNKLISLQSVSQPAYFVAPDRYRGDQRSSYNRELRFSLKTGPDDGGPRPSVEDIIIEGGGATPTRISLSITEQNNPLPTRDLQEYTYKLHENPEFGWTPSLRPKDFMAVLSNISSIKIRGSYVVGGLGFIDEVQLESAEYGGSDKPATWIERCECPQGYTGQFCEKCQRGSHHENNGGAFARCIPCNCNGHSDYCDEESGVCDCSHNTGGENCEVCAEGFYGDAILGTLDDCQECPCPYVQGEDGNMRAGKCYELEGHPESPLCAECPPGRIGSRCELCEDGYFGDPEGMNGPPRQCQKCECYGNIDESAIGNCDRLSGECLRCIDDTSGFNCEKCKSGFFGDALAPRNRGDPKNCNPCQCYPFGTHLAEQNGLPICNSISGKCTCKDNVIGHDCDKCKDGSWNIDSNLGCEDCNCDPVGSHNATCDVYTGQCYCREGIFGLRCNQLMPNHYGFSLEGGKSCDCDPTGSTSDQCDLVNGQCPCRVKVEGRKCDTCMENTKTRVGYGNEKICEPCDDCYNIVKDNADQHRDNLKQLDDLLTHIAENPEPIGQEFEVQLKKLKVRIKNMVVDSKLSSSDDEGVSLRDRLEELTSRLTDVQVVVQKANSQLADAHYQGDEASQNVMKAEAVINRARESLKNARNHMDVDGREALRRAQERSRKFGEGNEIMSELASKARRLAEGQGESASEIESIAKQANEISTDAYKKARDALEEQVETANQIELLQAQLREMGAKLSEAQSDSHETLKAASDAYVQALTIYQQVFNLQVPEVDTSKLDEQASKVTKDAERIRDDAQRLIDEHEELLQTAMNKRQELNDLLNSALSQQQQLDSRMADMDEHRNRSLNAVELGNSVLEEAKGTLDTLLDFEFRVNENRDAANSALEKVADIERILRDANENTVKAAEALQDTDNESALAYEIAIESKNTAEGASKNATSIVMESAKIKEAAEQLNTDAQSLQDKSTDTTVLVEEKHETSERDAQLASEALREANKAQSSSLEASVKVEQAKKELEEIAQILSSIEEQEPRFLDDLETRLDAAETKYLEANLEARLKELEEAKQRQLIRKTELKNEHELVKAEVDTIVDILGQLPVFCPNVIEHGLEN
eukprot:GFUD01013199.1.p1 GENE.GFUD01013199.1~~GFUD01013199.1.p1  ORF type:complete len:1692 (+),score=371.26 GFUD01013199.1:452-5527(+)